MKSSYAFMGCLLFSLLILNSCKKHDDVQPKETVVYQTNFDTDDGYWAIGANQDYDASIQNGYYKYINKLSSGDALFSYTNHLFNNVVSDIAIETSIKFTGTTTTGSYAGVCFNVPSDANSSYYDFTFYNNGYFWIGYSGGGTYHSIQQNIFSSAIKKNDFNVLRVEMKSGNLIFYINGTQVYQMAAGNIKLDLAGVISNGGVTILADYFKATKLQ